MYIYIICLLHLYIYICIIYSSLQPWRIMGWPTTNHIRFTSYGVPHALIGVQNYKFRDVTARVSGSKQIGYFGIQNATHQSEQSERGQGHTQVFMCPFWDFTYLFWLQKQQPRYAQKMLNIHGQGQTIKLSHNPLQPQLCLEHILRIIEISWIKLQYFTVNMSPVLVDPVKHPSSKLPSSQCWTGDKFQPIQIHPNTVWKSEMESI